MKRILTLLLAATLIFTACDQEVVKEKVVEENVEEEADKKEEEKAYQTTNDTDLFSGVFVIDGVEYSIPNTVRDFIGSELKVEAEKEDLIVPYGETVPPIQLETGSKLSIDVRVSNRTGEDASVYDSTINTVFFMLQPHAEKEFELIFPRNITFNSTYEEVIEAYGEPDQTYGDSTESKEKGFRMKYGGTEEESIEFLFYEGKIKSVVVLKIQD